MAVKTIDQQISDLLIQVGTQVTANGQNRITGPIMKDILEKIINLLNKKIGDLSIVGINGLETVADILAIIKQGSQSGGLTKAYNTFYMLSEDGSIPPYVPLNVTIYDPTDKKLKQRTAQGLTNPTTPNQNILYVESQFKSLYYWSGNDLVDIASTLSFDNKFKYIKMYSDIYPTNTQVAALFNVVPTFTLNADQILIIKVLYGEDKYNPTSYVFTLKELGANTYGQGSSVQLNESQVELLAISRVTPQDIEAIPTTQLVNLGEIGSQAIEQAFNEFSMDYNIQDQDLGYVMVKVKRNGIDQYYLFTGPGGPYGSDGTLDATADQFFLFEGSFGEGGKFEYQWDGTNLRIKNPNGQWGVWVDLGGSQGPPGELNYEWSGTRLRIMNSDGTWGDWVDLRPDIASLSDKSVLYFDYYKGNVPQNPQIDQIWYIESPTAQFSQYDGSKWSSLNLTSLDNMLFVHRNTKRIYYWNNQTGFIESIVFGSDSSSLRTDWEDVDLTPSTQVHIDMTTTHSHNLVPDAASWNAVGQQPFFRGFVGDAGAMEDGVVGYIRNNSTTISINLAHNDLSIGIPLFLSAETHLILRPQEIVWWKYSQTRQKAEITSLVTNQSIDSLNEVDDIYTVTSEHIVGDQVRLILTYPPRGGVTNISAYVNGQFITPTDLQVNGKELRIIMSNIEYELTPGDMVVVRYKY